MDYTLNYITIEEYPVARLHGFEHVEQIASVTMPHAGKAIIIETCEVPMRSNRFRISISKERIITSPRFYQLIQEYHLQEKRFIYNEQTQGYFSSVIDV